MYTDRYSCYEPVLKFITYFGIRCSVQVSDPSGGFPGLSRQLKAESELLRNPIPSPATMVHFSALAFS
jgi:hypothetical protein